MAVGRPTVSNCTGDLIDFFKKHKIGVLVSDDPDDFAANVLNILANDELCLRIEKNARQTAERHFGWSLMARKKENCFLDITQRNL